MIRNEALARAERKNYFRFFFRNHKSVKRLLIVFLILLIVNCVKTGIGTIKSNHNLLTGLEVLDQDTFIESLKSIDSDIEGMTQYDKYKAGLDYHDGSDSDHDGLTDKEEIEVYNTDPLKSSTMDDLYTDGYKVVNNMDPLQAYDMEKPEFTNNQCSEVVLSAENVNDLEAVVEDVTDRYSLSDYGINKIYKGYWLYNYSGTVTIDLTQVIDTNDEIDIWVYEGDFLVYGLSDFEKCKYQLNGNQAELSYDFNGESAYYIYITEKTTLMNKIFATASKKMQLNNSKDDEIAFLLKNSSLLYTLHITKMDVYYPEQDTDEGNENMKKRAMEIYQLKDTDRINFIASNIDEIQMKYEKLKSRVPGMETGDGVVWSGKEKNNLWLLIFGYWYHDDGIVASDTVNGSNSDDSTQVVYNNYHTTFDPYVDELPFQNFESEYGTSGNCTGIAHLTSYLFNTGTYPSSGSYNGITWNLNGDNNNTTLMDAGLSDYKTNTFVDDNSSPLNNYLGDKLSSGEQEFVKMIGASFQEASEKLPYLNEYMISNDWSVDWSVAETMMDYLDQGKILNIGLYLKQGSGHEITVYDYYFNNAGELIFRVYDSNIPQNRLDDMELTCDGACYLQCKKILRSDGTYGMAYLYYPLKGETNYLASSNASIMSKSSIIISDENWNVLN